MITKTHSAGNLLILAMLSACASAPLSDPPTARTLESDQRRFAIGYLVPGAIKGEFAVGVSDRLEVGGEMEMGFPFWTLGARARYSVVSPVEGEKDGFSLAPMAIAGYAWDSYYIGGGFGASYRWTFIEPFVFARYNYVINTKKEPFEVKSTTGEVLVSIPPEDLGFLYANLGATVWFTDRIGLAISAGYNVKNGPGIFLDDKQFISYAAQLFFAWGGATDSETTASRF